MFKRNFIILLLVILAVLPRFIYLNNVPNAINQDELHYVLDAKSFFLTGKDVFGKTSPIDVLLFNFPKSESLQAELPYFLEIPVLAIMGYSLFNLVLPNVLLGILTVALIYLIALRLFGKNTAILAGLIASINPWLIFLSRTTYEAGPATLFFLCIFYLLLMTKGWKILLAIPVALLAFYSYIGTKLIFIPFIFLSISYAYLFINKRKYLKQYSLFFLFSIILSLFFLFQFKHSGISRPDILTPDNPEITKYVGWLRSMTIQNPFMGIFENKLVAYSLTLTKNLFNAFSPNYLFVNADYFFMMGGHGLFYIIDIIFLITGIGWTFLKNKKLFIILLSFIFVGAVPEIIHIPSESGNFSPHIALTIPFLIILIGVGLNGLLRTFKQKKYLNLFAIIVGFLYLAAFANFCYFYFLKFPLQEATFESQNRILSKYISLYNNNSQISVLSSNPKLVYKQFIFYTNAYNKNTADIINKALKEEKFVFNNISFLPCDNTGPKNMSAIVISDIACVKVFDTKKLYIVQLKDSGKRYNVYRDRVCGKHNLPQYISNLKLSDLNFENLTEKRFCEKFIVSSR